MIQRKQRQPIFTESYVNLIQNYAIKSRGWFHMSHTFVVRVLVLNRLRFLGPEIQSGSDKLLYHQDIQFY